MLGKTLGLEQRLVLGDPVGLKLGWTLGDPVVPALEVVQKEEDVAKEKKKHRALLKISKGITKKSLAHGRTIEELEAKVAAQAVDIAGLEATLVHRSDALVDQETEALCKQDDLETCILGRCPAVWRRFGGRGADGGDGFSRENTMQKLKGASALGHNRYSTGGASRNAANIQPLIAELNFGAVALAHNGNLTNASILRKGLRS